MVGCICCLPDIPDPRLLPAPRSSMSLCKEIMVGKEHVLQLNLQGKLLSTSTLSTSTERAQPPVVLDICTHNKGPGACPTIVTSFSRIAQYVLVKTGTLAPVP